MFLKVSCTLASDVIFESLKEIRSICRLESVPFHTIVKELKREGKVV
ncbi:MAG: hypothetical protein ACFE9N_03800 [Promethearchaeota archaeon]